MSATRQLLLIFRRDCALLLGGARGRGGAVLPVLFFLSVAMLFPFAVGPDPRLLARAGGGVIWVAALLAAILPLDRLIEPDLEAGFFDQWAVRGLSEEAVMLGRIIAHWLCFGVPLMLATPVAAVMLQIDDQQIVRLELGLLLGTPGLAAIGVMIAALTAGLRAGAALGGLLLIPLAVPLLSMIGRESLPAGLADEELLIEAESLASAAMRV